MDFVDQYAKALVDELRQIGSVEHVSKAAQPIDTTAFQTSGLGKEMADAFIDQVVDESALLKAVRVWRTNRPSGEISKLDIVGYVTEKATENMTSTETRRPTNTTLEYTNKKRRSQWDITGEVEEDNIEGNGYRQTLMNMFTKAIANDSETLAIEGDESQAGTDDYSRLVKTNDGYHVQTTAADGTNIVNAGAKRVSWKLLKKMLRTLPTKYRTPAAMSQLRWIMSSNVVLDLQEEAEERQTGLGDMMYVGGELKPLRIPILEVPLLPENLAVTGTDSTGTFIWLTAPQNLIWVIQRALRFHVEEVPRYDRLEVTAFMRDDFLVQTPEAVVKATNIVVDEAVARFGAAA